MEIDMKLKSTLFTGVLAATMAVPVFANNAPIDTPLVEPLPQFTAADTQMLFEQDAMPMQLAALSQLEMKETEGAAPPLFWAAGVVITRGIAHYVPRGVISSNQAVNVARNGGQVFSNNARAAQQVANNAYGRGNVTFHNAHKPSPIFRPHFQPTVRAGNNSHIFIRR